MPTPHHNEPTPHHTIPHQIVATLTNGSQVVVAATGTGTAWTMAQGNFTRIRFVLLFVDLVLA